MRKSCLRHSTAFALVLSASTAGVGFIAPAAAQDAAQAEDADVPEGAILVTARRREERLVDVPIAVSNFGAEQLEQRGALDLTDIGNITPNTTLETSRGTNSTLSAFIRGIGQQDPVSGFEQGVGIYLDDVYLNRPQAAVLDIYDIERIEVLRGPQGTLYGRNTIGGAVKYVTRDLPQDFAFKFRGTLGTDAMAEAVATVSTPIGDAVRVGGSVARLSRGGFGDNLTTGEDNYNKDVWAARGTIEAGGYGAPFKVRLTGDWTHDYSNTRGGHRLVPGQASGAPVLDNVFDTRGGLIDPEQDVEAFGIALNASLDLTDALTIRSITGWRKDDSASPIDFDALPAADFDVPAFYGNEQFSQELQVLLDDGGPLTGLIGAYYLDAKADTAFDVRLYQLAAGFTEYTQADVDTQTKAIFADFSYDLTDQLSISAGARYTWDQRSADIFRQQYVGGGSPLFGGAGIAVGLPRTDFAGSENFNKFTPRASISFQPTPEHNVYASYSKGFKGGGFDPRGVGSNAPDLNGDGGVSDDEIASYVSFLPESVNSYEVGYKGDLAGGAIYVALAGFYSDYKNVQIPGSVACSVGGQQTFCGVVSNAGKATFKGVELETNIRMARDFATSGDRLNFAGSLGYIDAQYDEYITNIGGVPTDVAQYREVQNTPKWTASGTLSYSTPAGDGDLYVGSTLSYRSKTYQFEIPNPYLDQDGYALLDASIVYNAPGDTWSLGLYGKNLTDKLYKNSGYTFMQANPLTGELLTGANGLPLSALGTEGVLTAFYGNPRQVFVTGTIRF